MYKKISPILLFYFIYFYTSGGLRNIKHLILITHTRSVEQCASVKFIQSKIGRKKFGEKMKMKKKLKKSKTYN